MTVNPFDTSLYGVVCMGYWIPTGPAIFVNAKSDQEIIQPSDNPTSQEEPNILKRQETRLPQLESSVYNRLYTVLPKGRLDKQELDERRYRYGYPIFRTEQRYASEKRSPHGAIFVCPSHDLTSETWQYVRPFVEGLALVAHEDGFYLWVALYQQGTNSAADMERRGLLVHALEAHIKALVGGDFWAHSNGEKVRIEGESHTNYKSLKDYRDKCLGVLNYFQINQIFEGLHSYTLDPHYFFNPHPPKENRALSEYIEGYSIGRFFEGIMSATVIAPTGSKRAQERRSRLITDLHNLFHQECAQEGGRFFQQILSDCLTRTMRQDLLSRFMLATSKETLNIMGSRIESCSQMLLEIGIKGAHLNVPIPTSDVPPTQAKPGTSQVSTRKRTRIAQADENQLKGYVEVLDAKLPHIHTVAVYLRSNLRLLRELRRARSRARHITMAPDATTQLGWMWFAQLESLSGSLSGLKHALEQVHQDKMLETTKRIAEEQEILSELERMRQRAGEPSSTAINTTATILGVILATISTAFAATSGILGNLWEALGHLVAQLQQQTRLPSAAIVTVLVVMAVILLWWGLPLLYVALHSAVSWPITSYLKLVERDRHRTDYCHNDLDLSLEASTTIDRLAPLLAKKERVKRTKSAADNDSTGLPREHWSTPEPQLMYFRRVAYRENQSASGEIQYKIYSIGSIMWPKKRLIRVPTWFERRLGATRLDITLIQEIFYHSPSVSDTFVFNGIRLTSASEHPLSQEQLQQFRRLVVQQFVNPWIEPKDRIKEDDLLLEYVVNGAGKESRSQSSQDSSHVPHESQEQTRENVAPNAA